MTLKKKPVKIRLYHSGGALDLGAEVELNRDHAHYSRDVMRARVSDKVVLFDGIRGDWLCIISEVSSVRVKVKVESLVREHVSTRHLELYIGLVKKEAMRSVVRQATEMGVTLIQLVNTEYSVVSSVNMGKLRAWAIEASEQCGRQDIPTIAPAIGFQDLRNIGKRLILCDETGGGRAPCKLLCDKSETGIIIGPEGGFSVDELKYAESFCEYMSLGLRTLKVDTAVVTALAYVNEYYDLVGK